LLKNNFWGDFVKDKKENIVFPKGFLWGGTFSSYQIEKMNNKTNWDLWQIKGHIKDGSSLQILNDLNINLFNETIEKSTEMNFNSLSFSLEWAKVIPEMNFVNYKKLESYKNFILNLKKRNIEPIVILNYYTLPLWFQERGGFSKSENIKFYIDFVKIILDYIGNIVDYYITFFEPDKYIEKSNNNLFPYIDEIENTLNNIYDIHKEVYVLIKNKNKYAKISLTKNIDYNFDIKKRNLLKYLDFISLSYDGNKEYNTKKPYQKDDIGKVINPDYFYDEVLNYKKYDKPVLIHSLGISDENDIYRSVFLINVLSKIFIALKNNMRIFGFLHKSIFDTFEWEYGFSAKYGLYEFDYQNLKFHARSSSRILNKIIKNNAIPTHLEKYTL
jgi:beta-glucosidase